MAEEANHNLERFNQQPLGLPLSMSIRGRVKTGFQPRDLVDEVVLGPYVVEGNASINVGVLC